MEINSKVARLPFWCLYLVLAVLVLFNWGRVILFQKDFEVFRSSQPWDYYLSRFFAEIFEVSQRSYFVFALPVVLAGLYLVPKVLGKLMSLDKATNVRGDNHVALILILLTAPATFGIHRFLSLRAAGYFLPGVILVIIFSILAAADERGYKKKKDGTNRY